MATKAPKMANIGLQDFFNTLPEAVKKRLTPQAPVDRGLIGNALWGISQPLRTIGAGAERLFSPSAEINTQLLDPNELQAIQRDPGMSFLKNAAQLGSFAVPGSLGTGIGGLVKGGALAGGLQGFGTSQEGQELQGALTGTLAGGATGGLFGIAGKGLSALGKTGLGQKLRKFGTGRELNVFKREVGTAAPNFGRKMGLGGLELEKGALGLSQELGIPVKGAEGLRNLQQGIFSQYGTIVTQGADDLAAKGITANLDDVLLPLTKQLAKTKSPQLQAPIQKAIDETRSIFGNQIDIPINQLLNARRGDISKLASFSTMGGDAAERTFGDMMTKVYGQANNILEKEFNVAGLPFREINRKMQIGERLGDWIQKTERTARPVSTLNDMAQDVAGFGAIATGNPLMAAPGLALGKAMQSPALERGLANVANKGADILEGVGGLNISPQVSEAIQYAAPRLGAFAASARPAFAQQPQTLEGIAAGGQPELGPDFGTQSQQQEAGPNPQDIFMELVGQGMKPLDAIKVAQFLAPQAGGGKPLSAEQQKLSSNVKVGLSSIDDIDRIISEDSGALFKSTLPGFIRDPQSRQLATAVDQVVDVIGRLRSGGAITEEEASRFRNFLPGVFDDPETIKYKLGIMRQALSEAAPTGGVQTAQEDNLALGL